MAYDPSQLARVARLFERLRERDETPRAILLSAGGNDIAGSELSMLLNHAASGLPPLNQRIVEGVIDERLRFALASVIGSLTELARDHFDRVVPVLVHGYDYPIPDGRGYLGGFWLLPGPWLQPGFHHKGHLDLERNAAVMRDLMDRFNALLASLPTFPGLRHVSYLDLRGTLSASVAVGAYKQSWGNEPHPPRAGFDGLAQVFSERLKGFPLPGKATRTDR